MPRKIVFLGSPLEVTPILESLANLHAQGQIDLCAVVSQPAKPAGRGRHLQDPPIAALAKEKNIRVFQPESARAEDFLNDFRALGPDIALTAAYGQILSESFLAIPKRATINIHPSLLPEFRGATPVQTALLAGREVTGTTILFTVKALDAGHIIVQESIPIEQEMTADVLMKALFELGAKLIPEALSRLDAQNFSGIAQDESKISLCTKIQKSDGAINWKQSAPKIWNAYRAYYIWPGSFSFFAGERIRMVKMKFLKLESSIEPLNPGEFYFDRSESLLVVRCGDGYLGIERLLKQGGKEMSALAFWNGLKNRAELVFRNWEPSDG